MAQTEEEAEWIPTVLIDHPHVAQWLGNYVAQFSIFDFALLGLYSTVLGKEPEGTLAILGNIDSFAMRLDAIERYLPVAKIDSDLKKRIEKWIPEIRARNAFRKHRGARHLLRERPDQENSCPGLHDQHAAQRYHH